MTKLYFVRHAQSDDTNFQRILPKMPWVVCLHFEKQTYLGQEEWDLT